LRISRAISRIGVSSVATARSPIKTA
jgi:hypothetical protein